jgi:hypothetical protein
VRPVTVVVRDIALQDGLEMVSSEDEHAIETLTSQGPNEPLGERVRLGSLDRGADDFQPLG